MALSQNSESKDLAAVRRGVSIWQEIISAGYLGRQLTVKKAVVLSPGHDAKLPYFSTVVLTRLDFSVLLQCLTWLEEKKRKVEK